jgi:spore coat protein A
VPLAILDRSFVSRSDARLYYPMVIAPEFFGDYLTVNGKVAPYHPVDRGKYRLRLLNGCTARFLTLKLSNGASFQQIASEQGLLPRPKTLSSIRLAPGERAEIVVDFAGYRVGTMIELVNVQAADVFLGSPINPPLATPEPVLQFRVGSRLGHILPLPSVLRTLRSLVSLLLARLTSSEFVCTLDASQSSATRYFTLEELDRSDPAAPRELCYNDGNKAPVIKDEAGKVLWADPLPFRAGLNKVEIWQFTNNTPDTHPIHIHLAQFQVLERRNTPAGITPGSAEGSGIWKDTVQVHPGETVRLIGRFESYTGRYPFHCHILDHEDCEMMRWFTVAG